MGEARRDQRETNCPGGVGVLRAETSLSNCLRWSGRHIQQLLESAGPPSRPLLLQPLLWASNPVCDGVYGNKTNKKIPTQKKTHTLCSLLLVLPLFSNP